MERHTARSSAERTDISLSLESSKARRIFTLNTHEEKRLEKVRWSLEKQRMAETKRFLKAQKDTIVHHFASRKIHSAGKVDIHDRALKMSSAWMTSKSQEQLSSSSGQLDPQCLIPEKNNFKCKGKYSQKVGIDCSNTASVSYSVLPHMRRILVSEENLIQWCRSWSSRARTNFLFLRNEVDNDKVITKQSNSPTQETFIHKNSTEEVASEREGKERSLSEILPPVSLPPLHSQKEKTMKEQHRMVFTARKKVRNENLWDGLEDCRYIRTYVKNKLS